MTHGSLNGQPPQYACDATDTLLLHRRRCQLRVKGRKAQNEHIGSGPRRSADRSSSDRRGGLVPKLTHLRVAATLVPQATCLRVSRFRFGPDGPTRFDVFGYENARGAVMNQSVAHPIELAIAVKA